MKRPMIKNIIIMVMFLFFCWFSYAQNKDLSDFNLELADHPIDGIYKIHDVTIKFIPPPDWKIQTNMSRKEYGSIVFSPPSSDLIATLAISVIPMPLSMTVMGADVLESTKKDMENDKTVLKAEIITFADTKALSAVTSMSGIRTKQIQFYTDTDMYILTFLAEMENFDKLLPTIDESLKSFEIFFSDPEEEVPKSMAVSISPSGELFKKFESISNKLCLKLVVQENKIAKMRGEELAEKGLQEMVNALSLDLIDTYRDAFVLSESEATAILSGQYNNLQNKKDIEDCILEFEKLDVMLPLPIVHLIFKHNQHLLQDLDLEFAVRLFKEYLNQR